MLAPRWRKVLRDLWGHRGRTFLTVLAIAAGATALGVVGATYAVIARDLPAAYKAANPSHARIFSEPFDDDLVRAVRSVSGVAEVEGRRTISARLRVGGADPADASWRTMEIYAIPDFDDISVNKIYPEQGASPPAPREILIERAALPLTGAAVGDTILMRLPNDEERELRVTGLVHDITLPAAAFVDSVYGYISYDSLEWLGFPRSYNELQIRVAENASDREHTLAVATAVRAKVEKSGRTVFYTAVADPGRHPFQRFVDPMAALLTLLGFLALGLSAFLVVNTISALLAQQVRQIGMMKAVCARARQVAGLYLVMAFLLGVAAFLISAPAAVLVAGAVTRAIGRLINFDTAGLRVPGWVFAGQAAAAVATPLLAALGPVRRGARITVREAITSYGVSLGAFGRGPVDRLVTHLHLPRSFQLSLRNTFRQKRRLLLTVFTLALGTTISVSVFTVRASLLTTLDDALKYWQYDVGLTFNRPYRIDDIERRALAEPGVERAESWGYAAVRRQRPDGAESDNIVLVAPPAETELLQPEVLRGRWLLPQDESAIVINSDLLRDENDLRVGGTVRLVLEGRVIDWTVVGIIRGVLSGPVAYANYPYFAEAARLVDRASSVQVVAADHDPASQARLAQSLEKRFEAAGMRVNGAQTMSQQRLLTVNQFNVILVFLLLMAVVLAAVGALGLAGTMSINVLERTREIGVMRAVGATGRIIRTIVVGEGALIGALSWALGVLLAAPVSRLLASVVGSSFLATPLRYTFSATGAVAWLAAVLLLAGLASLAPARAASRLSVREVLAYE